MSIVSHGLGTTAGLLVSFGLGSVERVVVELASRGRVRSPELQWLVNHVRINLICKIGSVTLQSRLAEADATIIDCESELRGLHTDLRRVEETLRQIRRNRRNQ